MKAALTLLILSIIVVPLLAEEYNNWAKRATAEGNLGLDKDVREETRALTWVSKSDNMDKTSQLLKRLLGWKDTTQWKAPPESAVKGGYDKTHGSYYYVCVASHNGGQPGKFFRGSGGERECHFGYGGKELKADSYKVLTDTCAKAGSPIWPPMTSGSSLPAKAVVGGHEGGHTVYICAASFAGVDQPGKLFRAWNNKWECHIGWGGAEKVEYEFKVLVDDCN